MNKSNNQINPIIEFYEYHINSFNKTQEKYLDRYYKFGDFRDSAVEECGVVGIEGNLNNFTHSISSCDPISTNTLSGGKVKINLYDIDNLYDNYKKFLVKYSAQDILDDKSTKSIVDNINMAYNVQKNIIENLQNKITINNYLKENENNYLNTLIELNETKSLLFKVELKITDKIIIIGDLHGSFHTFFRILCRLHRYDILDLETFTLNKGYKIIFLGDVLDRGDYGLDIINVIVRLIIINNQNELNIIYNRGNHETFRTFADYGGTKEFKKKFQNNEKYNQFLIGYIRLLNILSSAILLSIKNETKNKFIWCSHGGFPRTLLKGGLDKTKDVILFDNNDTTDIRWSDFGLISDEEYSDIGRGGDTITYSNVGTNNFLQNNNIDFIIRAHQDRYGNSILFYLKSEINNGIYIIGERDNISNKNGLIYNKNKYNLLPNRNEDQFYLENQSYLENRYIGAIARLDINTFNNNNFFKVLTLSTNTDKGRYLQSDSFGLLRFDITDRIQDFKSCLQPVKVKKIINLINKKSSINKGDILKDKLNIIFELIQLIGEKNYSTRVNNIFNETKNIFDYLNRKFEKIYKNLESLLNTNIDEIQHKYILSYNEEISNIIKKISDIITKIKKYKIQDNSMDDNYDNIKKKFDELNN